MTYCVGFKLDEGLVFLSDSRTNAGIDHINTFRKIMTYEKPGERVMVLLTSGNLAISQAVVNELTHNDFQALSEVTSMVEAARAVGEALRRVHARDAQAFKEFGVEFTASFIFGGQVVGHAPKLFMVYAAGNFIEASEDCPYFQIGESKYGKPILDRVIRPSTSLYEAAKCALISMDSTIRSNLSVGLPLDLLIYRTDELRISHHRSVESDDPYYNAIRNLWGERLREAFHALPDLPDF